MKPASAREFFSPDLGLEVCAFCEEEKELQLSHIIPGFVIRWLRDTSATGHVRVSHSPNQRVQDGWKAKMLCWDCEQLFGAWEKSFAELAFQPLHSDRAASIMYGSWLSRFAAAQSWRVLRAYSLRNALSDHFSPPLLRAVERALARWKDFLLGRAQHPGSYELHALRVDIIQAGATHDMPPNINRYLARAVDLDVVAGQKTAFVYSKLARIVIVGFIEMPSPRRWKGTRVSPVGGDFGIGDVAVPGELAHFFFDKARRMGVAAQQLSDQQQKRISDAVAQDPVRAANSELAEAVMQDVAIFGESALRLPEE